MSAIRRHVRIHIFITIVVGFVIAATVDDIAGTVVGHLRGCRCEARVGGR